MAYVARTDDFDCGIMISASHNPYYDNGIKLINSNGEQMDEEKMCIRDRNVTLDEKVIVYGGVDKVAGKAQSLGGADSYNVTEGDGAFNLGVTAEDNAKLTYSSDNNGVVRVDENGNVTIAGVGTATITVKSEATTSYKAGSKTITITVNAKPQPNQTPSVTIGCGNKTVTEGDAPFSLGASASNRAALSYQYSDHSIASVDGAGNVTIYRAGSVQITAIAGEMAGWNSASSSITVTVNSKPQPQPVAPVSYTHLKKQYLERGIAEAVDDEYQIFLAKGNDTRNVEQMKKFDEMLREEHPGVYQACNRKSVWMLRKTGFKIFPMAAWVYSRLRGN